MVGKEVVEHCHQSWNQLEVTSLAYLVGGPACQTEHLPLILSSPVFGFYPQACPSWSQDDRCSFKHHIAVQKLSKVEVRISLCASF